MLAQVRNAVVHGDAIISEHWFRKLRSSNLEKEYAGTHIPGIGYTLDFREEPVQEAIQRLREYGLAIYKAVSDKGEYSVLLYNHDEGITEWKR